MLDNNFQLEVTEQLDLVPFRPSMDGILWRYEGSIRQPWRSGCLVTMKSWVQVLETASCRNAGKDCIHKT
jgi:hypothetical protein